MTRVQLGCMRLSVVMLMTIAVCVPRASAQITELIKPLDPISGDPTTQYCLSSIQNFSVVPGPNEANDNIQSVVWSGTATCDNCTTQLPAGQGDATGLSFFVSSLGTITITAKFTDSPQSNGITPASTTATQTFTFVAPKAVLVYNDPNRAIGLNNQTVVQWQLQYGGFDTGGYNFKPIEKITFIEPANTPSPYNGGWGSDPQLLSLDGNGLLSDIKGPNPNTNPPTTFANCPLGTIM